MTKRCHVCCSYLIDPPTSPPPDPAACTDCYGMPYDLPPDCRTGRICDRCKRPQCKHRIPPLELSRLSDAPAPEAAVDSEPHDIGL